MEVVVGERVGDGGGFVVYQPDPVERVGTTAMDIGAVTCVFITCCLY